MSFRCSPVFFDRHADLSGGTYDNTFGKYFEGYVGLGWGIDENSKRPYALIDIATLDDTLYNSAHNYIIGFEVEGEDGQRFEAYASEGIYGLENYGIEGWDDGSRNRTISSMATGKSTLCVGSQPYINEQKLSQTERTLADGLHAPCLAHFGASAGTGRATH